MKRIIIVEDNVGFSFKYEDVKEILSDIELVKVNNAYGYGVTKSFIRREIPINFYLVDSFDVEDPPEDKEEKIKALEQHIQKLQSELDSLKND